jgi:hypothetical protein
MTAEQKERLAETNALRKELRDAERARPILQYSGYKLIRFDKDNLAIINTRRVGEVDTDRIEGYYTDLQGAIQGLWRKVTSNTHKHDLADLYKHIDELEKGLLAEIKKIETDNFRDMKISRR